MKTTIAQMGKIPRYSKEWFEASFEGVNVPDYIKVVAAKIASVYNIGGQSDDRYIANLIYRFTNDQYSVCPKSPTGEHSDVQKDYCIWCYQNKK